MTLGWGEGSDPQNTKEDGAQAREPKWPSGDECSVRPREAQVPGRTDRVVVVPPPQEWSPEDGGMPPAGTHS